MKKKTLRFMSVVLSAATAFTFAGISAPETVKAAESVAINATNFPDENFRNALSTYLDRDSNGSLSSEEISTLTTLYIDYSPYYSYSSNSYSYSADSYGTYGYMYLYDVENVTGIENFTDLNYVTLSGVSNTSIDFTKMSNLENISITYCGQLTSIDVTGLNNLYYLSVDNCGVFESLDVSTNTNLYSVTCAGNDLFTTFKNSANNKYL